MASEIIVPVARPDYVVVHYHIFKNAGSTVEGILRREFQEQFAMVHGRESDCALDAADLMDFLRRHREIRAVSSHHLRYPKPRRKGTVFFDCCFLRDPLERLYSCYQHFRRSGLEDTCSRWARSYTPREFLARLINEAPHQVSNLQVNQLANAGTFLRPADERDLERAATVVRDMALPGVVEIFDESLVAAEYYLRPAFPSLRLEYVRQNVSQPAARPQVDWQQVWGSDLQQQLLELNTLDRELLRRARTEIFRRLAAVPRFAEKLQDFRWRCARLSSAQPIAGAPPAAPAQPAEPLRAAASSVG